MSTIKNKQINHEHSSWQRTIEFFRQENALLKYRLSEMVDNNEDSHFLQIAEYFQNELLLKDEMLKKIIRELQEYSDLIQNQPALSEHAIHIHNRLRNDILLFQKRYMNLSKEFNEKMLQNF